MIDPNNIEAWRTLVGGLNEQISELEKKLKPHKLDLVKMRTRADQMTEELKAGSRGYVHPADIAALCTSVILLVDQIGTSCPSCSAVHVTKIDKLTSE